MIPTTYEAASRPQPHKIGCDCSSCLSFFNGSPGWLRIKNAAIAQAFSAEFPHDHIEVQDFTIQTTYESQRYVRVYVERTPLDGSPYYCVIQAPVADSIMPPQIAAFANKIRRYFIELEVQLVAAPGVKEKLYG